MADSPYPSQIQDKFMIRLPDGMRDRIKAAAEANNRSMNAEIIATLEERYPAPKTPQIGWRLYRLLATMTPQQRDDFTKEMTAYWEDLVPPAELPPLQREIRLCRATIEDAEMILGRPLKDREISRLIDMVSETTDMHLKFEELVDPDLDQP